MRDARRGGGDWAGHVTKNGSRDTLSREDLIVTLHWFHFRVLRAACLLAGHRFQVSQANASLEPTVGHCLTMLRGGEVRVCNERAWGGLDELLARPLYRWFTVSAASVGDTALHSRASAALLCPASALGELGGVARGRCRHGCIVPARSSPSTRRVGRGCAPRRGRRGSSLGPSASHRGEFLSVCTGGLSPSPGIDRAVFDARQCAPIPRSVRAHGDRRGLRVSPVVLPRRSVGDSLCPEVCLEGGSRIGRFGGLLHETTADVAGLSNVGFESLRRPVRGAPAALAEERRSRLAVGGPRSRVSQLPG